MSAPTKSKTSDQRPDAPSFQMPSNAQVLAASEAMLMLYPEARITRIGPDGVTFEHTKMKNTETDTSSPSVLPTRASEVWDQTELSKSVEAIPDNLRKMTQDMERQTERLNRALEATKPHV